MADNLKKYHFVCYYCGAVFSQKTINKKCEKNTKVPPKECILKRIRWIFLIYLDVGFTKKTPFNKYNGNLQHFFGYPNEFSHRNVKSLFLDDVLEKNEQKTVENEKKNLKTFLGFFFFTTQLLFL